MCESENISVHVGLSSVQNELCMVNHYVYEVVSGPDMPVGTDVICV